MQQTADWPLLLPRGRTLHSGGAGRFSGSKIRRTCRSPGAVAPHSTLQLLCQGVCSFPTPSMHACRRTRERERRFTKTLSLELAILHVQNSIRIAFNVRVVGDLSEKKCREGDHQFEEGERPSNKKEDSQQTMMQVVFFSWLMSNSKSMISMVFLRPNQKRERLGQEVVERTSAEPQMCRHKG